MAGDKAKSPKGKQAGGSIQLKLFVDRSLNSQIMQTVAVYCGLSGDKLQVVKKHDKPFPCLEVTSDKVLSKALRSRMPGGSQGHAMLTQPSSVVRYMVRLAGEGTMLGRKPEQVGMVDELITVAQGKIDDKALVRLDQIARARTFLASGCVTVADLAILAAVRPQIAAMDQNKRAKYFGLVRWFDLVQHHHRLGSHAPAARGLDFMKLVPHLTDEARGSFFAASTGRKSHPGSPKKGKGPKSPQAAQGEQKHQQGGSQDARAKAKADKKAKKEARKAKLAALEKAKGGGAAGAITAADIRVGRILDVKVHPSKDNCFVETIDVGEDQPRSVVSGLRGFIPEEKLKGSLCVLIVNLKPAEIEGATSNGRVLVATSADKKTKELVIPPGSSKPGVKVVFKGFQGAPAAVCNSKKMNKILKGLKTSAQKVAQFNGVDFEVPELGSCACASIASGTIA